MVLVLLTMQPTPQYQAPALHATPHALHSPQASLDVAQRPQVLPGEGLKVLSFTRYTLEALSTTGFSPA